MKIKKLMGSILVTTMFFCTTVFAADLSSFNPHRSPQPITQNSTDNGLSCTQLDREIARITPYTYNYRTDFDKDPYAGASIIAGATISLIGYGYLAFSAATGFIEDKRIHSASAKIDGLRRLKAEKHCYEDRG